MKVAIKKKISKRSIKAQRPHPVTAAADQMKGILS